MTTLQLPQLAGHDLLTHSRFSCFGTCPRKHYYQYEMGIRRERQSQPLRLGSAFHLGLDLRAQGKTADEAILGAVAGYEEVPAWCNTPELLDEWVLERETVARLLSGYFWRWGEDRLEVVATEMSFQLPIRNPETGGMTNSFKVAGKIDKIVKLPDGRLAVMEHKTTGDQIDPDSDYWRRLRLDQQISLYYSAARELGYDVQTVLYDVVRKPSIAPRQVPLVDADGVKIVLDAAGERVKTKNGKGWRQSGDAELGYVLQSRTESMEEFGERLTNDIAERPDFYYARQEIPRLESDLAEFAQELWEIQQTLRACQNHGRWYRRTSACIQPYRCEFLDVCHNGIDVGAGLPAGFVRVENTNPELEQL